MVPTRLHKVPVVINKCYTISFENTNDLTFIHCDVVGPWSADTLRLMRRDFAYLQAFHGAPIYALHDPTDAKHLKFLRTFGFRKVGEGLNNQNNVCEVFCDRETEEQF